jgi:hypothetical protein
MNWKEESLRIIDERYRSIRAAQPPTVTDKQVLRMVSLHHYPFGPREYHPYRQWCKALREYGEALKCGEAFFEEVSSGPLFSPQPPP